MDAPQNVERMEPLRVWVVMGDAGYGDGCWIDSVWSTRTAAQAHAQTRPCFAVAARDVDGGCNHDLDDA